MRWRNGALLREAALNLRSGAIRLAVAGGTVFAVLLSVALLELRDADDLLGFQEEYARAGGYVAVVSAPEGEELLASRCEALNGQPGIVAAGSVGEARLISFATAPGVLFQRAGATLGAFQVWAPGAVVAPAVDGGAVVVGAALAEEVGLGARSHLQVVGEAPLAVAAVVDTADRNPQVARWALDVEPPSGIAAQCWVEMTRETYPSGLAALPAWFTSGDEPPNVIPYRRTDEFARDPAAEFAGRPQRLGWMVAGAMVVAMAWLMTWFRRSELGLYLALGTPRSAVVALLAAESWLLVVPAAVAAWVYAVALGYALGWDPGWGEAFLAARTMGSAALVALFVMPLAPLVLVRGSIAELLKDR